VITTRKRATGVAYYWLPSKKAVHMGYPSGAVNLTRFHDREAMAARFQERMTLWIEDRERGFAGTIGSLLETYMRDPLSRFQHLPPNTMRTYRAYAGVVMRTIGPRRLDDTTGLHVIEAFEGWSCGRSKLAAGHMALTVLKAAVSFGVLARLNGCAEFKTVLKELRLPHQRGRDRAPTRAHVRAVVNAALRDKSPSRALAYAIQFETGLRQSDVLSLRWDDVSADGVLRVTPSKTKHSTRVKLAFDLTRCPMVMALLEQTKPGGPDDPIVRCEGTGMFWRYRDFLAGWHKDATASGFSGLWNRDLRAGHITEAGKGGAALSDRAKAVGHSSTKTTVGYDRDTLAATRRVADALGRVE